MSNIRPSLPPYPQSTQRSILSQKNPDDPKQDRKNLIKIRHALDLAKSILIYNRQLNQNTYKSLKDLYPQHNIMFAQWYNKAECLADNKRVEAFKNELSEKLSEQKYTEKFLVNTNDLLIEDLAKIILKAILTTENFSKIETENPELGSIAFGGITAGSAGIYAASEAVFAAEKLNTAAAIDAAGAGGSATGATVIALLAAQLLASVGSTVVDSSGSESLNNTSTDIGRVLKHCANNIAYYTGMSLPLLQTTMAISTGTGTTVMVAHEGVKLMDLPLSNGEPSSTPYFVADKNVGAENADISTLQLPPSIQHLEEFVKKYGGALQDRGVELNIGDTIIINETPFQIVSEGKVLRAEDCTTTYNTETRTFQITGFGRTFNLELKAGTPDFQTHNCPDTICRAEIENKRTFILEGDIITVVDKDKEMPIGEYLEKYSEPAEAPKPDHGPTHNQSGLENDTLLKFQDLIQHLQEKGKLKIGDVLTVVHEDGRATHIQIVAEDQIIEGTDKLTKSVGKNGDYTIITWGSRSFDTQGPVDPPNIQPHDPNCPHDRCPAVIYEKKHHFMHRDGHIETQPIPDSCNLKEFIDSQTKSYLEEAQSSKIPQIPSLSELLLGKTEYTNESNGLGQCTAASNFLAQLLVG